jgi:GT2 family glycosyltransferase
MPRVSAVIPNYNGRHLLARHLPAVVRCLRDGDQIVLVDDASTDDSLLWLKNQYQLRSSKIEESPTGQIEYEVLTGRYHSAQKNIDVIVVRNVKNIRFGAAANRGVEVAKGELILLLNSDVSPHTDILDFLLPYFEDAATFAVGCVEEEKHGHKVVFGGRNTLTFQRGMFIHARATKLSSGKTAWVTGGSGLFDRAKWLQLGGFDQRYYPAYWEDVDLGFQARKRGWKVLFESQAVVEHNHESTNKDAFGSKKMQEMSWQNAHKFVWKNGNLSQKVLYLLWQPYWRWKVRKGHRGEQV